MDTEDGHEPLTLYLDVDGVVTSTGYQERAGKDHLDPACMAIVAGLVRDLPARVVVSSTWRVDDCRPALVEGGLPEGCFHDDWKTAILPTSRDPATGDMLPAEDASRGYEVTEHARRNGISRYLVLDDVDVGPAHEGHHVRPDPGTGMTRADDRHARELVGNMAVDSGPMRSVA